MNLWTEVKCHACSRICGEIEGVSPPVWVLSRVNRIFPVGGCGVMSTADLRCDRWRSRLCHSPHAWLLARADGPSYGAAPSHNQRATAAR